MGMMARLNRLFGADGKCLDVAVDHGIFGELSMLPGLERMQQAVDTLVQAAPDAIQMSPGLAPLLQNLAGPRKPALVMRADVTNAYARQLPRHLYSQLTGRPVEQAVRLDAACIVVNLLSLPDQPEVYEQCVANICRLKPECEQYGMPLMIEPLVMQDNAVAGGYMVDGDIAKILPLVRQAVELGADVIKADPTDDLSAYHRVIETASGRPVLVRGGGKVSDTELIQRTYELMKQGARGVVYGRNIVQHPNPGGLTRALMALVHDDAPPQQAVRYLEA